MALGTWDPSAAQAAQETTIDSDQLDRFIGWASEQQLDALESLLNGAQSQRSAGLMRLEASLWTGAAQSRPDEDLIQLIRFFTVAEKLPGWEAGQSSPVIPLAKVLRQRGSKLDRELLQWIRANSDNRFLPYGPL
jgi:hypothetical protein